jgi:hypothetical protein
LVNEGTKGKFVDLNKLEPKALAAAMKGGTAGWGQVADARAMVRYSQPVRPASRRRCPCGCETRATHMGMANGLALASGCSLAIARWVKTGFLRATKTPNVAIKPAVPGSA